MKVQARSINVTFHVDVAATRPCFQIPRSIPRLFSLKSAGVFAVSISTPQGELIYHGLGKLDFPDTEKFDLHVGKILKKGQEIRVTVALPPEGTVLSPPQSGHRSSTVAVREKKKESQ